MRNVTTQEYTIETIVTPPRPWHRFFFFLGLVLLALNRVRYAVRGYRVTRQFPVTDIARVVEYDVQVVRAWLERLKDYAPNVSLTNARVLELGPGADLGTGCILLAHGARHYTALDIVGIARRAPDALYDALEERFQKENRHPRANGDPKRSWIPASAGMTGMWRDVSRALSDSSDRMVYRVDPTFSFDAIESGSVDIVFSQAAFEHFDDVERTARDCARVVRSGGVLIAEVDLSAHARWICDADPLNIYRFSLSLYTRVKFRSAPNRVRIHEYKRIFEAQGWTNVRVVPLRVLPDAYVARVRPYLAAPFRALGDELRTLSLVLCATR